YNLLVFFDYIIMISNGLPLAKAVFFFGFYLMIRKRLVNIGFGSLQRQKLKIIMKLKLMLMVVLLAAVNCVLAQEIQSNKFGKGLFNIVGQDSSWAMKVGLRMQLLGTS